MSYFYFNTISSPTNILYTLYMFSLSIWQQQQKNIIIISIINLFLFF